MTNAEKMMLSDAIECAIENERKIKRLKRLFAKIIISELMLSFIIYMLMIGG